MESANVEGVKESVRSDTVGGGERSARAVWRRLTPFAAVALLVVAVDQVTKALIRGWLARGESWPDGDAPLRLTHIENSGAAFGILQGAGPFLLATTLIGVAAVAVYLFLAPAAGRLYTLALALVLGGAIGNLIDRAVRGTVTDFIDPTHYPAFNIADSAIVIGVAALAWLSFREDRTPEERARDGGPHG